MITNLNNLSNLAFPIATIKKPKEYKETESSIILDGIEVTKQGSLYDTFSLQVPKLPETYHVFLTPGILLQDPKLINKKCLIDDNLILYIPYKQVNVKQKAYTIQINKPPYFMVNGIEYYFENELKQTDKYPILSYVDGVYYHSGWTSNIRYENEFNI